MSRFRAARDSWIALCGSASNELLACQSCICKSIRLTLAYSEPKNRESCPWQAIGSCAYGYFRYSIGSEGTSMPRQAGQINREGGIGGFWLVINS